MSQRGLCGAPRHLVPVRARGRRERWLLTLDVAPASPTLVIGRGGRDGETGDLADFLARAIETYEARRDAAGEA